MKFWIAVVLIFCTSYAQQFPVEEFAQRRQKLYSQIDGIAVIKGGVEVVRNNDINYPFRQNSDFYYLTGFDEPGAIAVFTPGEDALNFILFIKPFNPLHVVWEGKHHTPQSAQEKYGADTVYTVDRFADELASLLRGSEKVYLPFSDDELLEEINNTGGAWFRGPDVMQNITPIIGEMRLYKSAYEIQMLQKSIDITVEAQIQAMMAAAPGATENEIAALIEYTYTKNGSPRVGFPSIVASGANATVLHYSDNNDTMQDGDLLLMDIGAEYGMYSADVTRTIPVNGNFSKEQTQIYNLVLKAQNEAIEAIKPGIGFREIHRIAQRVLSEGLFELGLITDPNSTWQTRAWFMHGTSHWLGLDTHDASGYRSGDMATGRVLEAGMVLTVEPGLYFAPDALDNLPDMFGRFFNDGNELTAFIEKVRPVFEKYKNIGVRIEDDILVTEDGYVNLSKAAPRSIPDIEQTVKKESYFGVH